MAVLEELTLEELQPEVLALLQASVDISLSRSRSNACSPCAGVIVSGIALVISCCLREAVQLTDSLKAPAKAALTDEEEPLIQV